MTYLNPRQARQTLDEETPVSVWDVLLAKNAEVLRAIERVKRIQRIVIGLNLICIVLNIVVIFLNWNITSLLHASRP